MPCEESERLEQSWIEVRKQRARHIAKAALTPELEEQLSRTELEALFALLDHRAVHRCQGSAGLPASRRIGGIIGPY